MLEGDKVCRGLSAADEDVIRCAAAVIGPETVEMPGLDLKLAIGRARVAHGIDPRGIATIAAWETAVVLRGEGVDVAQQVHAARQRFAAIQNAHGAPCCAEVVFDLGHGQRVVAGVLATGATDTNEMAAIEVAGHHHLGALAGRARLVTAEELRNVAVACSERDLRIAHRSGRVRSPFDLDHVVLARFEIDQGDVGVEPVRQAGGMRLVDGDDLSLIKGKFFQRDRIGPGAQATQRSDGNESLTAETLAIEFKSRIRPEAAP